MNERSILTIKQPYSNTHKLPVTTLPFSPIFIAGDHPGPVQLELDHGSARPVPSQAGLRCGHSKAGASLKAKVVKVDASLAAEPGGGTGGPQELGPVLVELVEKNWEKSSVGPANPPTNLNPPTKRPVPTASGELVSSQSSTDLNSISPFVHSWLRITMDKWNRLRERLDYQHRSLADKSGTSCGRYNLIWYDITCWYDFVCWNN